VIINLIQPFVHGVEQLRILLSDDNVVFFFSREFYKPHKFLCSMKKVFLIMKRKTIEQLANRYQTNPLIRGLIQLVPCGIGSALDVALVTALENIHNDKLKEFFDELNKGAIQLTPETIESENFLHCYFSTVRAALNSRRREKIRYFARLLTSSINLSEIVTVDEYEEYISILDELSFRELGLLVILSRYEKENFRQDDTDPIQRPNRFWDQFSTEVCSRYSISEGEFNGILARLNRTGLYRTIFGMYPGYRGSKGELTPMYAKLEKMIRPDEDEFE
jgi:hypothetical protein